MDFSLMVVKVTRVQTEGNKSQDIQGDMENEREEESA